MQTARWRPGTWNHDAPHHSALPSHTRTPTCTTPCDGLDPMIISQQRINWLRAQYLISMISTEHGELSRARRNSNRLGFVLRAGLPVQEAGAQYEMLIQEVDRRIRQLDARLFHLRAYAEQLRPDMPRTD